MKLTTLFRTTVVLLVHTCAVGTLQARSLALEEIVVTAQKREATLQDTPIALDAFGEVALEREGIGHIGDLANNVPALTIEPFPINSTQLRIYIRGIGSIDAQLTQDPPVGVYLDGAYIARSSGLATDVTDLQRIEVLRGPQGTLYGRNSTGGAVNMITKRPNVDNIDFKQSFDSDNRGMFSSKTSLNLPLWQGAAVKLAFLKKTQNGFIENDGQPEEYGDYGDKETLGYRVDFGWDVNDWLRLDYAYDYADIENTNYAYTVILPSTDIDTGDAQKDALNNMINAAARQYYDFPMRDKRPDNINAAVPVVGSDTEIEGHQLTAVFSISEQLEITYIYAERELFDAAAADLGSGQSSDVYRLDTNAVFSFPFDAPQGVPQIRNTQYTDRRPELTQEQFSHELQFSGSLFDNRLDYITGLYYFEEKGVEDNEPPHHQLTVPLGAIDFAVAGIPLPGVGGLQILTTQIPTIHNTAAAIFAQLTWRPNLLNDRLSLTFGARHSEDTRKATQLRDLAVFAVTPSDQGILLLHNILDGSGDQDFSDDSFSFTFAFEVDENTNLYLKRQEAYKSGGFNLREDPSPAGTERFNAGFDAEKVTAWELGIKAELFDHRLRINSDVFITDFVDQQLSFTIPGSLTDTSIANAGSSQLNGFEMDVTFVASRGLVTFLNYAYLYSHIDPSVDPLDGEVKDQFIFNSAPRHAFTTGFDWTLYQGDWGRLSWNAIYSYTDERNGGGIKKYQQYDKQDDFNIVNSRIGLYDIPVLNGALTVAGWVKNLEDTDYVINAIHNTPHASRAVMWGEPRTYGLELIYRYSD